VAVFGCSSIGIRGGSGTSQMGANGRAQFQLRGWGAQYAAELRISLYFAAE